MPLKSYNLMKIEVVGITKTLRGSRMHSIVLLIGLKLKLRPRAEGKVLAKQKRVIMDGLDSEFEVISRSWEDTEGMTVEKLDEIIELLDQAIGGKSINYLN